MLLSLYRCSSPQPQFCRVPVFAGQGLQFVPGCVLDLDAVLAALLLTQIFDLTGIEHAGRTLRRRRRLQIARELGDFPLEILQRAKGRDIEYRHEASVVVTAGGLDAEAK